MSDQVIYTAIYGGYDVLRPVRVQFPGVRWLCFTDDPHLSAEGWEVIQYPAPYEDPRKCAKFCKVNAHELLNCKQSLWLDASLQVRGGDPGFDRMKHDLALTRHPRRRCVYEEGAHLMLFEVDSHEKISEALKRYEAEGYPRNKGLYRGGLIWRRHTLKMVEFNERWWDEIDEGSIRDQLSLPVVIWRMGLQFDRFSRTMLEIQFRNHAKRGTKGPVLP